jgi:ATP-binding cassette subfamily B protein
LKRLNWFSAHDFIERLPDGYDYNVMERGATLSVGQRQLISFVRALVHDPKVIVLDEATSSVDTETEEMIQNAIAKLMKGRTAIVIAHRLSTIQNANKILVLDKGEIKEEEPTKVYWKKTVGMPNCTKCSFLATQTH